MREFTDRDDREITTEHNHVMMNHVDHVTLDNALLWKSLEKKMILIDSTARDPFPKSLFPLILQSFSLFTVEKFNDWGLWLLIVTLSAFTRPHLINSRTSSANPSLLQGERARDWCYCYFISSFIFSFKFFLVVVFLWFLFSFCYYVNAIKYH